MKKYDDFLKSKETYIKPSGFEISENDLNINAFEYQKDIAKWAIRKGKAAIFADCGMGKTLMQLDFAYNIAQKEKKAVLIIAPLSVTEQTRREGKKFGYNVNIARSQEDCINGINITNYEMIDHFDAEKFCGVILDESSILKSFSGKIKRNIIDKFKYTKYKLACTATPAPNDFIELGNHAEFLNIMSRSEMLATYFIHDGGDTSKWRLKGHAESAFWEWVASWACVITRPSDLGYSDEHYMLPEIKIIEHIMESAPEDGMLCVRLATSLSERREARKESIDARVKFAAKIANESKEQFLIWCDYNAESKSLAAEIRQSVEVCGADQAEHKAKSGVNFADGIVKCLISKPSIYGFGMNWQNCHNIIFCGLSDSYEQFYQAIRRCWRFGQKNTVTVHIIISEKEINVLENIKKKQTQAEEMKKQMIRLTKKITMAEIKQTSRINESYIPQKNVEIPSWVKGA